MQRFGNFAAAIIASLVLAQLMLLATGLFGEVPCGEDGWRWGIAQGVVEIPVYIVGLVFAIAGAIFKFMSLRLRISLLLGQAVLSAVVVVIVLWPNLVYVPPECL